MIDARTIVESTLVPHLAFERAVARLNQCFEYAHGSHEPICVALLGETRTGKSRALEECFRRHPRFRTAEGLTVPIMRVKTPSKPTVKGLTEILLHSLGDPRALSGTENGKTIRILKLMHGASTKMLMIDEFQHFYDKGSNKVMHHVADWLKILVDEAKIALVVSGIPSCRAVIEQNEQLSGRFMAPIVMPRFDWSKDEERDEFTAILGAFHESLSSCFDLPALDSNDMAFRCYCATGGLIGYLTKFLRQVVWNALDNASRVISIDDLAKAHEQAICKDRGNYNFGPFDSHSQLAASAELMASVMALGRGTTTSTKTRRGRHPSSSGLTPRDVLTAS